MGSLPMPDLARVTRAETLAYFEEGWRLTTALFDGLANEDAFQRPPYHHLRHPLVFYLAHPAAFFMNQLRMAGIVERTVDPALEAELAVGVDEMPGDGERIARRWPPSEVLAAYRARVHGVVREVIERHPGLAEGHPTITSGDPLWALFMALEHERIHLETSSVLVRELPLELVRPPAGWPALAPFGGDVPIDNPLLPAPGGTVRLGKPRTVTTFGWDCEHGARTVVVAPFHASRGKITNAELAGLVADGGYRQRRWWTDAGWAWREKRGASGPTFWRAGGTRLRTCFEEIPLPPRWPAIVNHHEATAYCAWRSARDGAAFRLLREAEHWILREDASAPHGLTYGSESAIDQAPPTPRGFLDPMGNVWDWCEETFAPLPGFEPHPYYPEYSTPSFDQQHNLLLGGCFAASGDAAGPWCRNNFRPHFFQHAGFRVALSGRPPA